MVHASDGVADDIANISDVNETVNIPGDEGLDSSEGSDEDSSDDSQDIGDGSLDDETAEDSIKTFDDIQVLIDNASPNSTIELNGTYISSGKAINVNKTITIQGLDETSLVGNITGIFNITGKNVVLKDLAFIDSNFKNSIGIYSAFGLTISGCKFSNNTGLNYTLISLKSGYSNFTDVVIANNTFDDVLIKVCQDANMDISNACFDRNHFNYRSSGDNGAIIFLEGNNRFKIVNSNVTNNNDVYKKNGEEFTNIFVYSGEEGNINVNNCFFNKNSLPFSFWSSNCIINNSKFLQSGVLSSYDVDFFPLIAIENSVFINLTKGLHFTNCLTRINKCNFTNNSCTLIDTKEAMFMCNTMNLTNSNFINNSNTLINIKSSNAKIADCKFSGNKITNNKGIIYLDNLGGRTVTIKNNNNTRKFTNTMGTAFDNSLKAYPFLILKNGSLVTSYHSEKYFQFKLVFGLNNKVFDKNFTLRFEVKKGKKSIKNITAKNFKKGFVRIKGYNLPVGTYKVYITVKSNYYNINHMVDYEAIPWELGVRTFKINKAKTIVKAPKVTHKRGKSKYFKVTVKNKVTKKAVKGLKVKLRIYTGKKYKTYTVKTDKKGVAKFNTKKLKKGNHKVVLLSGNSNFVVSGKTSIKIK